MWRWLLSIMLALLVFVVVALLLGYILYQGKQESYALKQQIELEKSEDDNHAPPALKPIPELDQHLETKQELKSEIPSAISSFEILKTQLNHQTCATDNECQLIFVPRHLGCTLTINQQGDALLTSKGFKNVKGNLCSQDLWQVACLEQRCQKVQFN